MIKFSKQPWKILNMVNMNNNHILFYKKFLGPEVANISEQRHEGAPDLRAAQAVDVEVEGEVEELEVVGDGAEDLEAEVLVLLDGVEHGEHRGGRGADHEQHNDRDQDNHQHTLL